MLLSDMLLTKVSKKPLVPLLTIKLETLNQAVNIHILLATEECCEFHS